ncbi:MAG: CRISPR-associated helicase Cas3' [Candidatus Rokuibacteriota bacterium]
MLDLQAYRTFFERLTGRSPYEYQVRVAAELFEGRNVVLRAPTGAGKTCAVLAPFLFEGWNRRPARLIYALPLRTLAQGVYRVASEAAASPWARLGREVAGREGSGREGQPPYVTLQTGEQPDDRFFDRGRIVVTTYDQLLSGLLCGPYGLSERLHNINAASIVGAVVVFDEFHLMEPHRAFLTGAACLNLFRGLCQSVWMTATATRPLEQLLGDALDAVSIPETAAEADTLLRSLPTVTAVRREMRVEAGPLSADAVIAAHRGRSIVLLNTVGRAQAMFEALRDRLRSQGFEGPIILLHSRFFSEDRRTKEVAIQQFFGWGSHGPAALVATQVIEAGLDISCDDLHTELCPMNALVQRAGRCARFEGEEGTVHVYALPEADRAWLPYGDVSREAAALTRTRELLGRVGQGDLHPRQAAAWIQEVHGEEDERALREGWRSRRDTCVRRIRQNTIERDPVRVADLIRGDDSDSIRIVITTAEPPENPGHREGLSLSRWSLAALLRNGASDVGWFWNPADDRPWVPLTGPADLRLSYVVCLSSAHAAYDADSGLRLGVPGTGQSPPRREPRRPGYSPLRAEAWVDHARRVAEEAARRLERERWNTSPASEGFLRRYDLSPRGISNAARICALLHDLGKLTEGWQRWAEAAQRAREPGYVHAVALAHTDFDPEKAEDWALERSLPVRRPAHAPASAYYGRLFIVPMLGSVSADQRAFVASACLAAILAHHGGWWRQELEGEVGPLWCDWPAAVEAVLGPAVGGEHFAALRSHPLENLLRVATGPDHLEEWWPIVAYLTRTLRLSDQRATAEAGCHE